MPYLTSSIPYFKAWVRREYTKNLEDYHGEFLHAMVIGVTTIPNRSLSFQVIFTGCESDDTDEPMFMVELCGLDYLLQHSLLMCL